MCRIADLRYYEVIADDDDGEWLTTNYYTVMFNGWKGFIEESTHSQATSFGWDKYDGLTGYHCHGCVVQFGDFRSAQLHCNPDETEHNPDILRLFGLS